MSALEVEHKILDPYTSLQEQWEEVGRNTYAHYEMLNLASIAVHQALKGYENDDRLEIALGMMAGGDGQQASVLVTSDPGTGKTTLGNRFFGHERRAEITPGQTDSEVYGYESAFRDKYMPGLMAVYDDHDRVLFLNEGTIMAAEPSVFTRIWDSRKMFHAGKEMSLEGASIYVAGNFPNGRRVKPSDDAFLSRIAMQMLLGDMDDQGADERDMEIARRFNLTSGDDESSIASEVYSPIVPSHDIRQQIRHINASRHPVALEETSFRRHLYNAINDTGLFNYLPHKDSRKTEALITTARARALMQDAQHYHKQMSLPQSRAIGALDMANVSDLVIAPTLKPEAIDAISEFNHYTPADNTELVLVRNRLIAELAIKTWLEKFMPTPDSLASARRLERIDPVQMVDRATHANLGAASFDVNGAIKHALEQVGDKRAAELATATK